MEQVELSYMTDGSKIQYIYLGEMFFQFIIVLNMHSPHNPTIL